MVRLFTPNRNEAPYVLLETGQTAYACVYANKTWNDSGIDVISGQSYTFNVPASEKWRDWWAICGASGYCSRRILQSLQRFRRAPKANWLQLIGIIGDSFRTPIVIGSNLSDFLPPCAGRLYFLANDLPWLSWSNKGMVAVRITRMK